MTLDVRRIGSTSTAIYSAGSNFVLPEVIAQMFAFISSLCVCANHLMG